MTQEHKESKMLALPKAITAYVYNISTEEVLVEPNEKLSELWGDSNGFMADFILHSVEKITENGSAKGCVVEIVKGQDKGKKFAVNLNHPPRFEPSAVEFLAAITDDEE